MLQKNPQNAYCNKRSLVRNPSTANTSLCDVVCAGVDGWLARRLTQCSRFGAWLDVVVDNLGRGMLWSLLFEVSICKS